MADIVLDISLWIHVLSAIAWFGSIIAVVYIIIPSIANKSSSNKGELLSSMSKRFARVSEVSSLVILITGVYQTYETGLLNVNALLDTLSGNLLVIKVLFFIVFAAIGVRAGIILTKLETDITKEKLDPILKRVKILFYVDSVIGLIIILIGIVLTQGVP